jgi:hypothetical protein
MRSACVTGFPLLVKEQVDANGGAPVRKLIDDSLRTSAVIRKVSGDINWVKCKTVNGTRVCIGVEVQVPAPSVLLDMIHLHAAFRDGRIDIGLIIVPSDRLSRFLTDRPCASWMQKARSRSASGRFFAGAIRNRA